MTWLRRIEAALARFEDTALGMALTVAGLFTLLWLGLWACVPFAGGY